MALMPALTQYYRADIDVTGSDGGVFQTMLVFAHPNYYYGDGAELAGGSKPGLEVLRDIADGIASGLIAGNGPSWASAVVTKISAQPGTPNVLYEKPV